MTRRPRRTALFVDFDNIVSERPLEMRRHPERWLAWLARGAFDRDRRRNLVIKRVYWNAQFADWRETYEQAGFTAVDCRSPVFAKERRKSLADVMMTADMMDVLTRFPEIDEFIILSLDTDFAPAAARLRHAGRAVTPAIAHGKLIAQLYEAYPARIDIAALAHACLTPAPTPTRLQRWARALKPAPKRRATGLDLVRDADGLLAEQTLAPSTAWWAFKERRHQAAHKLATALERTGAKTLQRHEAMSLLRGMDGFSEKGRNAYLQAKGPAVLMEEVARLDARLRFDGEAGVLRYRRS